MAFGLQCPFFGGLSQMLKSVDDLSTYAALIRQIDTLEQGKRLHLHLANLQLDRHTFIGNLLIQMYSRCRSLDKATSVFETLHSRNVFSWTNMISAHAQNGHPMLALIILRRMDLEGIKPNRVTFVALLAACSSLGDVSLAHQIHARVACPSFWNDEMVATTIISMFGKCASVEHSRRAFDKLRVKTVIVCNAMLAAYTQNGHLDEAIDLYHRMELQGLQPDAATFVTVLSAASALSLELGISIHAHAISIGLHATTLVGNCLVNMYAKCKSLERASHLFENMYDKNVFSWTIMMAACAEEGHSEQAVELFHRMELEGTRPDKVAFVSLMTAFACSKMLAKGRLIHDRLTHSCLELDMLVGTSILNMYVRCGSLQEARIMFWKLDKWDVVLWNSMLVAEQEKQAVKLYEMLSLEGIKANEATFAGVIDACSTVEQGKRLRDLAWTAGLATSLVVANSLLGMFGRCGSLAQARTVFDTMRRRNVATWNSMIDAYACNGFHKEAVVLFEQMDFDSIQPDEWTLSSVLRVCSSLNEIRRIHAHFSWSSTIPTVVGTALVMAYGRCRCLQGAQQAFAATSMKSADTWNGMIEAYLRNGLGHEALHMFRYMELEGVKASSTTLALVLEALFNLDSDVAQLVMLHERDSKMRMIQHDQKLK